ncbi:MAG: DUF547 domain-containing protein [Dehalococcoidia bacterium]
MTRPPTDRSLLRFLRSRGDDTAVLNGGEPRSGQRATIAEALVRAARDLPIGGQSGVPYEQIAASPRFAAYRALTRDLRCFDPGALGGRRERTAFWINVYNALVIDAVISFGVRESIREAPGFFHRAAYRVGPYRLALDEIEHGLLRGNRPLFARLPTPFPDGDPRAALGPGMLDPRVHFALNCGTRSCPPVAFYEATRLDEQLDAAAASFINGGGVRLDDDAVVLSPLFSFYEEDFGGAEGAQGWALRYLEDAELRARLVAQPLRTGEYDWSLNRG